MSGKQFYWPQEDEHIAIVGRNGTGKSQLGFHVLSLKDHKKKITIALDYKREKIFRQIKNMRWLFPEDKLPKQPGIYAVQCRPRKDDDAVEDMLERILDRERTGLFVDEGYMLPYQSSAFMGILTQGRSKRIPVITLSQRPVKVHSFAFSEASHIAVFDLNKKRDWQTVEENTFDGFADWLPEGVEEIPEYHSRWFASKLKRTFFLKPVPKAEEIASKIDAQLPPVRRWL